METKPCCPRCHKTYESVDLPYTGTTLLACPDCKTVTVKQSPAPNKTVPVTIPAR